MRIGLVGLAALAAMLGGAALLRTPTPPPGLVVETRTARAAERTVPAPTRVEGAFAEQVERPLFRPGRRPQPPPDAIGPEPVEPDVRPPAVAALGVVVHEAGAAALLRLQDGQVLRVALGDDVAGWEVRSIDAGGVELVWGERVERLSARLPSAPGAERTAP